MDWSDKGSFDASTIDDSLTTSNANHNGVIVVGGDSLGKKFGLQWPLGRGGGREEEEDNRAQKKMTKKKERKQRQQQLD